jgi:hypothetical protein
MLTTAVAVFPIILIGIVAEIAARSISALMSTQIKAKTGLERRMDELEHKIGAMFKWTFGGLKACFAIPLNSLQPHSLDFGFFT